MVIKYCISVLHPLLYNLLEIFIFFGKYRKYQKSQKYHDIFDIFDILIFSKILWYFPTLIEVMLNIFAVRWAFSWDVTTYCVTLYTHQVYLE